MITDAPTQPIDRPSLNAFVALAGPRTWKTRLAEIGRRAAAGPRAGQAIQQRHAIELTIERLRRSATARLSPVDRSVMGLVAEAVGLARELGAAGRVRLDAVLQQALTGEATLVPLFHLLRTASLHRARGFAVRFAGLEDSAVFDLRLHRDGVDAEVACDVMSAEEGRLLHRGAWFRLADLIDPELQIWLAAHPGRYLLKMTLPRGLRAGPTGSPEADALAALHRRIRDMLAQHRRSDHDEAVVLRLDPLLLVAAQADDVGLVSRLRREFGPEAHLSVTASGGGVFAMAARAGRENEIAAAVRRRMATIAPTRLTGTRPGILAMFVEDTDRGEWHALHDRLELEGEARQFLAHQAARNVVAVTCTSRAELFGQTERDGEVRFRNPAHPAARVAALAPAVLSSV